MTAFRMNLCLSQDLVRWRINNESAFCRAHGAGCEGRAVVRPNLSAGLLNPGILDRSPGRILPMSPLLRDDAPFFGVDRGKLESDPFARRFLGDHQLLDGFD